VRDFLLERKQLRQEGVEAAMEKELGVVESR
jgi:hypothetical protein